MLDLLSFVIGCVSFFVINILGDLVILFESFLIRKCNVGMTRGEMSSFRKFLKDCYGMSYWKFSSLDSRNQVSILSSFFGIDAMH